MNKPQEILAKLADIIEENIIKQINEKQSQCDSLEKEVIKKYTSLFFINGNKDIAVKEYFAIEKKNSDKIKLLKNEMNELKNNLEKAKEAKINFKRNKKV